MLFCNREISINYYLILVTIYKYSKNATVTIRTFIPSNLCFWSLWFKLLCHNSSRILQSLSITSLWTISLSITWLLMTMKKILNIMNIITNLGLFVIKPSLVAHKREIFMSGLKKIISIAWKMLAIQYKLSLT